jgi:predicted 3-demethylubiquinone-9 3-methyltransferase (glyoxalase superfamily)
MKTMKTMKILRYTLPLLVVTILLGASIQPGRLTTVGWDVFDDAVNRGSGVRAMPEKQKITTFLWFNDDAEEAIRLYTSVFKDSKVLSETRWGEGGPRPKGTLMTARFQLAGQEFMALNGGPQYRLTEAISLLVDCETQEEVDELWEKLSAGGEPGRCGWLKDRYGLSWQIVPSVLGRLLGDKDAEKAKRVAEAMMGMGKLDIRGLQKAYDQR